MKILFIGDVVGKVGRRMLKDYLGTYVEKYGIDFVIANGENVTHGKGLIQRHYQELLDAGVDCITLGNHYNSKNEINRYIDSADRLVRPLNLLNGFRGDGSVVYDLDGVSIRVTNLLGSAFMEEQVNNPYYAMLDLFEEEPANIHIVDFHAEATGEKQSLGYVLDGKVSALLGTHTHVQTNDCRILPNGTAYISDVGMTGFNDGVLGFEKESVIRKNFYGEMVKFTPPEEGVGIFSAVVLDINEFDGKTRQIFPILFKEEKK